MRRTAIVLVAALAVTAVLAGGCYRQQLPENQRWKGWIDDAEVGVTSDNAAIELQGATNIDARISMGAGHLTLAGGSAGALDADYDVRPSSWAPEIEYDVFGGVGRLHVRQPSTDGPFGDTRNAWDLKLASGVPVDLDLGLGAGESSIDLREIDVRKLNVQIGAGEAVLDLSGERTHDVEGNVQAGAGSLTIRLPRGVGVRVNGRHDGIGSFEADGFSADGNAYVNDAWSGAGPKIELNVQRAVGEVKLELVD